ncbi:unnamed protein product, partial [marine sediment metagenome]
LILRWPLIIIPHCLMKVARIKELEIRLDAMCNAWDPDDFDDLEKLLALYEKLYDQAVALAR